MSIFYQNITEFDKANEDLVSSVKIMTVFFEADGNEEETKKKAILLSSVWTHTYKLLKSLSMPTKPTDKTF